jgi:hypothetical protein
VACSAGVRLSAVLLAIAPLFTFAHTLPLTTGVDAPSLTAQVKRVIEALDDLGTPLPVADLRTLEQTFDWPDAQKRSEAIQNVFDHHCLFAVTIDSAGKPVTTAGLLKAELIEQGWKHFLIKVVNEARATTALQVVSPQAGRLHGAPAEEIADRWLDAAIVTRAPLAAALTGERLEYRILQLYSRDLGKRAARIGFMVGAQRGEAGAGDSPVEGVLTLFDVRPSQSVRLPAHGRGFPHP